MKRTTVKRGLALMLSTVLFLALPFFFTQEVSAASKTKTFYVISETQTTYTNSDGSTEKNVTKYTYGKNGLCKSYVSKGYTPYSKTVFTRNSAGIVTNSKSYNEKGKLTGTVTNTVKNGRIVKSKQNEVDPKTGKKKLLSTTTTTYKKGKPVKEVMKHANGAKSTATFNSKGVITKYVYADSDSNSVSTYDKNGRIKSYTSSFTYNDGTTSKSKSTYSYKETKNKHGDPVKTVETEKETRDGVTTTTVFTNTYKYTYKSGRIVKLTNTNTIKSDNFTSSSKYTTTRKYKAVKVPQKYWKFFE